MINLLPYDTKKQIRAARTNIILVRYLFIIGFAAIFLAAISGTVYIVLSDTKTAAEGVIASNESKANTYGAVQAQISAFRASLSNAKSIISQSVSYSNVLIGIAGVLPSGVVLDSLNLSASTFGAPITLLAHAKTNDDALKLKQNFQASPLFSGVNIVSLSKASSDSSGNYPIAISLSVIINKVAAQ